jgi:hypothetical protein
MQILAAESLFTLCTVKKHNDESKIPIPNFFKFISVSTINGGFVNFHRKSKHILTNILYWQLSVKCRVSLWISYSTNVDGFGSYSRSCFSSFSTKKTEELADAAIATGWQGLKKSREPIVGEVGERWIHMEVHQVGRGSEGVDPHGNVTAKKMDKHLSNVRCRRSDKRRSRGRFVPYPFDRLVQ